MMQTSTSSLLLRSLAALLLACFLVACSSDDDTPTPDPEPIPVVPEPRAAFSFSPESPEAGDTVVFTNSSENATRYSWAFGDGTTASTENPTHIYDAAGTYTITLTASGEGGDNSSSATITVREKPVIPMPITITHTDFLPSVQPNTQSRYSVFVNPAPQNPAEGENLLWDFSNVVVDRSFTESRLPLPDGTRFTDAIFMDEYNSPFNPSFVVNEFRQVSEDGYATIGSRILPVVVDLGGGASLESRGQEIPFDPRNLILPMPIIYGQERSAAGRLEEPYLLTAPGFGLSNAPVSRVLEPETNHNVVGWGKIILPSSSGETSEEDVLLVKVSTRIVESYFLNGAPAPTALTSAVGLSGQRVITTALTYYFVSKTRGAVAVLGSGSVNEGQTPTLTFGYYLND